MQSSLFDVGHQFVAALEELEVSKQGKDPKPELPTSPGWRTGLFLLNRPADNATTAIVVQENKARHLDQRFGQSLTSRGKADDLAGQATRIHALRPLGAMQGSTGIAVERIGKTIR